MVHIKRIELSNFKSFGNTTKIPLQEGFTVVSGPNGSGKSNILDALLFCLGLASSKGMRADRLPDLVNHNQSQRQTSEVLVTVTFDLTDLPNKANLITENQTEWSITRKLKVTKQGYTSTYYINGSTTTQQELHETLQELRIYPEGYNVVLQGDVTSIITMNPKERRQIIDELAGVASYDRKIIQVKQTLEEVKNKQDQCRIVEAELIIQRDRLQEDRHKAEKYQKLKSEYQSKQLIEKTVIYLNKQQKITDLRTDISQKEQMITQLTQHQTKLTQQIEQTTLELATLNHKIKQLGEDELIKTQTILANQNSEQKQLQTQIEQTQTNIKQLNHHIKQTKTETQTQQQNLEQLTVQLIYQLPSQITTKQNQKDNSQYQLEQLREQAIEVAAANQAWVNEHKNLTQQIDSLLITLDPNRAESAQLTERVQQLNHQQQHLTQNIETIENQLIQISNLIPQQTQTITQIEHHLNQLTQQLTHLETEQKNQIQTQTRLQTELSEKQRQSDKIEATTQAQKEITGTYSTQIIIQSGLKGIHGLVAQLGKVEPRYQLALEIAAGSRLGQLVVDNDTIATSAIEILKQKKAGRITFLPLNKIRSPRPDLNSLSHNTGFIDHAINLVECDRQYQSIFAYVFGNTLVFHHIDQARKYIGQHRIVTLAGELLETTGAITGGTINPKTSLHFGTLDPSESDEAIALHDRIQEITQILQTLTQNITTQTKQIKELENQQNKQKTQLTEEKLYQNQTQKQKNTLTQQLQQNQNQLQQNQQQQAISSDRLNQLKQEIPQQEELLQNLKQQIHQLEKTQSNQKWITLTNQIKTQEKELEKITQELIAIENQQKELENQRQYLTQKLQNLSSQQQDQQTQLDNQQTQLENHQKNQLSNQTQIQNTQTQIKQLEQQLGTIKQDRDQLEQQLTQQQKTQTQTTWEIEKHTQTISDTNQQITQLENELAEQKNELPDTFPPIPESINLEQLQKEIKTLSKKLTAMEPVNMLALEEYEKTNNRLEELSQKLNTLDQERNQLLLRIENFTTLRLKAFSEAFEAVNQNFQTIFAELSDGDGSLVLENTQDPFAAGLNLVAHPKGKPVKRLTSMSGGEKSLTALSFIFALQRYRPSPFYAFDEVDMFLDGANVHRLALMIKKQAQFAQFIVVSLRRPMIESSQRTIGVTQARGAYTQVLGIQIQSNTS